MIGFQNIDLQFYKNKAIFWARHRILIFLYVIITWKGVFFFIYRALISSLYIGSSKNYPFGVTNLRQSALIESKTGNRRKDDMETSENMNELTIKFDTLFLSRFPSALTKFGSIRERSVDKGYLRRYTEYVRHARTYEPPRCTDR